MLQATKVEAWPTTAQWIPVFKNGDLLQDSLTDANGSRNIVSSPAHDAAFIYNDGNYMYFRLRLDSNPAGSGGQGLLASFGWGVLIDSNNNAGDYEWSIMVDGIGNPETIVLWQNSTQGTMGSPNDGPETSVSTITVSGNIVITAADTTINGNQDYFVDWRFPYSTFKTATGINDNSPIRLWFGSSSNGVVLSADLVAGSDLYTAVSDPVKLVGTTPTTGAVMFVADAAGNGDVTMADSGASLYVRVNDSDINVDTATTQTVTVTLTTQTGDTLAITLTETGANTGIFTGSATTSSSIPILGNNILEVMPSETVTVTYHDQISAGGLMNQTRTDTLQIYGPTITIAKVVDVGSAVSGATATYTITVTNSGPGDGWISNITDTLPNGFTYITGNTSGLTTSNPTINGQNQTWSGSWTVPKKVGIVNGTVTLIFKAKVGGPNTTAYNTATVSGANFTTATTGHTAPVVVTAPQITLTKTTSTATVLPGATITYTVRYQNIGGAAASVVQITDSIPTGAIYSVNSLKIGGAAATCATATAKTDAVDGDEAELSGSNIIFKIGNVSANDSVPNSGTDEGIVCFTVSVN
ncbi:MAG TPA: DUF11 domain-containing protein [Candidatus Syntrophosphaera sp.]|nr:DUF11 domain-containing protein [Candidatus Syntrophosphaera sp.]HPN93162.1 DUF11 domain-containing protein [bacterium]